MSRLRIAHLNFINDPGVNRKLREEAGAARALGLPIDFYLIDSSFQDHEEGGVRYCRSRSAPIHGKAKLLYSLLLEREDLVAPYLDVNDYDLFVIRFGKVFLGQGITYARYARRIVTEHHADEIAELLLKDSFARRLLGRVSLRRSRRALARVGAVVAMTAEIADLEVRKAGREDMPRFVYPNGVEVSADSPAPREYRREEPLKIAFAAARYQAWQGLDRLLSGLATYAGSTPVHLRIAGILEPGQIEETRKLAGMPNVKVEVTGLLDRTGLLELYAWAQLGIAALSMSRNRIREACPLKVREYAARGLPFVYSFSDPDFPREWPFALRLDPDESPVDVARIVRFAEDLYAQGDPGPSIHSYARENLDWKAKISRLYEFLCSLPV